MLEDTSTLSRLSFTQEVNGEICDLINCGDPDYKPGFSYLAYLDENQRLVIDEFSSREKADKFYDNLPIERTLGHPIRVRLPTDPADYT